MKKLSYSITLVLITVFLFFSCGKEIDGPSTENPGNLVVIDYGSLNIYLKWTDFSNYCDSIPVLIDDEVRGYLKEAFDSVPNCYAQGTLTVDGLPVGPHKLYVGDCGIAFWEMNMVVLKDQCLPVQISN